MSKIRKEKLYLTGRIRRQVTLTRKEEGLIQIRFLGINLRISLRITIKEHILKIKYHIILQQQKEGTFLKTLLKIMNIRNLSSVDNVKDHIITNSI